MKETRIRGLIPRYESKKVFHIENTCKDLEEEYERFPKSAHDDCLDTTAYQNQIAAPPSAGIGDLVTLEDMEKCLTKIVNDQSGTCLIGVSTSLPVHYVIGNKQGLFYNAVTNNPKKDIAKHFDDFDRCFVFADQVGDIAWLKELQESFKGKIFVCFLKAEPKSQNLIKWGVDDKIHEVEISRSGMIQQIVEEMRTDRFTMHGSIQDWQEYITEWSTLYRLWEEDSLGERVATWESNARQGFIKSTIYYRTALERFGMNTATFIPKANTFRKDIPIASKRDNSMPGSRFVPKSLTRYDDVSF